jgi:hypothetical protein
LNYFSDESYAFAIDTPQLDWRPDLNVPISKWEVPSPIHRQLGNVLNRLDLAMGIFDLKESPSGEIVFLEVNSQGQFLFLKGITQEPLTEKFADYLENELKKTVV